MKNSKETLEQGKFYTTRISDCTTRQHDLEGYVISIKNQPKYFKPKRCFNPQKEKKFFIHGKGWQNIKPNNIELVTVPTVETYAQVLELVKQYGYRCACQMVGFSLPSYGDHYPISDIAKMEVYGAEYVEYLERIASMDFKILNYITSELKTVVKGFSYDMWITSKDESDENYECSFRVNPFLGYHLETCLFGMVPITPNVNPVSFDSALREIIMKFHPEYKHDSSDIEKYSELRIKFDRISVKGWIEIMCGKADADWLSENLTLKAKPIAPEGYLDSGSPSKLLVLSSEIKSDGYKKRIKGL